VQNFAGCFILPVKVEAVFAAFVFRLHGGRKDFGMNYKAVFCRFFCAFTFDVFHALEL